MKKVEFCLNIIVLGVLFFVLFSMGPLKSAFSSGGVELEIPGYKKIVFTLFQPDTFYIGSSNQTQNDDSDDLDFEEEGDDLDFLEEDQESIGEKLDQNNDEDSEEDEIYKEITLDYGFLASVTEVSQGLYKFVMKNNPSCFFWSGDEFPVEQVSWMECLVFCNRLSELCGYEKCYNMKTLKCDFTKNGFRLPTEAEWEYISRSKKGTIFFFGNNKDKLLQYANTSTAGVNKTQKVGSLKPNDHGVFDIYGNVWEWCYDVYDSRRRSQNLNPFTDYDTEFSSAKNGFDASGNKDDDLDFLDDDSYIPDDSAVENTESTEPVTEKKEDPSISDILSEKYLRVIKGGGWGSSYYDCRSANRGKGHPAGHYSDVGFRIVRTVKNK